MYYPHSDKKMVEICKEKGIIRYSGKSKLNLIKYMLTQEKLSAQ